jgi:hypothetical protein
MIETIKIGHMIGPPLRKLSIKKLPVKGGPAFSAGLAEAAGDAAGERLPLNVAVTLAPGAGEIPPGPVGDIPGAGDSPSAGDIPVAGGGMGATGLVGPVGFGAVGTAGFWAAGAGAFGGGGGGGGAGRFWANAVKAVKLRQIVSSVFIIAAILEFLARLLLPIFIPNTLVSSPVKTFHFSLRPFTLRRVRLFISDYLGPWDVRQYTNLSVNSENLELHPPLVQD